MSRDELIAFVGRRDGQITEMAGRLVDLLGSAETYSLRQNTATN
jgi:hypothetical protein